MVYRRSESLSRFLGNEATPVAAVRFTVHTMPDGFTGCVRYWTENRARFSAPRSGLSSQCFPFLEIGRESGHQRVCVVKLDVESPDAALPSRLAPQQWRRTFLHLQHERTEISQSGKSVGFDGGRHVLLWSIQRRPAHRTSDPRIGFGFLEFELAAIKYPGQPALPFICQGSWVGLFIITRFPKIAG